LAGRRVETSLVAKPLDPEGGGDFFVVRGTRGGVWVALGDVMGHGPQAACHAHVIEGTIDRKVGAAPSPAALLGELQRELYPYLRRERTFASLLAVRLDPEGAGGVAASAGQCPPFLVRHADGQAVLHLGLKGLLLGGAPNWTYVERTFAWQQGDALVLYSDGVVEASVGDRRLGEEGLVAVLTRLPPGRLDADRLLATLEAAYPGLTPADDFTLATVVA
jgi:sigma-B regulation protein RsbU (phosphoserine phosphatase)